MATYMMRVDADTLDAYSSMIMQEEAGGAEFQDSDIGIYGTAVTNLVTFKELTGTRPEAFKTVLAGAAAPKKHTKIKDVVVYVGGSVRPSSAYRAND